MIFFFNLEPTNIVRKDSRIFWNLAFFFRATNKKTRFFSEIERKKNRTRQNHAYTKRRKKEEILPPFFCWKDWMKKAKAAIFSRVCEREESSGIFQDKRRKRGENLAAIFFERKTEWRKQRPTFFKSVIERGVIGHFSRQAKKERGNFSRHFLLERMNEESKGTFHSMTTEELVQETLLFWAWKKARNSFFLSSFILSQ